MRRVYVLLGILPIYIPLTLFLMAGGFKNEWAASFILSWPGAVAVSLPFGFLCFFCVANRYAYDKLTKGDRFHISEREYFNTAGLRAIVLSLSASIFGLFSHYLSLQLDYLIFGFGFSFALLGVLCLGRSLRAVRSR
ncbi:MAG: hypothetical protein RJB62_513 [Pseudomonadota bacterium]